MTFDDNHDITTPNFNKNENVYFSNTIMRKSLPNKITYQRYIQYYTLKLLKAIENNLEKHTDINRKDLYFHINALFRKMMYINKDRVDLPHSAGSPTCPDPAKPHRSEVHLKCP